MVSPEFNICWEQGIIEHKLLLRLSTASFTHNYLWNGKLILIDSAPINKYFPE